MKRGKPLARKTPIRRSPMRRGTVKSSYKRRPRDFLHMATVRRLACIVRAWDSATIGKPSQRTKCYGHVEADHAGERAFGRKAPDITTIPMCRGHHGERTDYRGTFRGFDAVAMRAFCDWAIARTQAEVAEMLEVRNG